MGYIEYVCVCICETNGRRHQIYRYFSIGDGWILACASVSGFIWIRPYDYRVLYSFRGYYEEDFLRHLCFFYIFKDIKGIQEIHLRDLKKSFSDRSFRLRSALFLVGWAIFVSA